MKAASLSYSAVGHETDFLNSGFLPRIFVLPRLRRLRSFALPEYDARLQHTDGLVSERLPRALNRSIAAKRDRLLLLLHARGFSAAEHSVALKRQILENAIKRLHIAAAYSLQEQPRRHAGPGFSACSLFRRRPPYSEASPWSATAPGIYCRPYRILAPDMEIMNACMAGEANARVEHIQSKQHRQVRKHGRKKKAPSKDKQAAEEKKGRLRPLWRNWKVSCRSLNSGNISLEDMVALYERGAHLGKRCMAMLDEYQGRLEMLDREATREGRFMTFLEQQNITTSGLSSLRCSRICKRKAFLICCDGEYVAHSVFAGGKTPAPLHDSGGRRAKRRIC
jgi:exodeoxyribonuclease VII small subunit